MEKNFLKVLGLLMSVWGIVFTFNHISPAIAAIETAVLAYFIIRNFNKST